MNGFRTTFRVVEADLNARREDYSLLNIHDIALGRAFPESLDYIDQNVRISVSPIKLLKWGSDSSDGPVGRGHYYPQRDHFTITTYCANPSTPVRTDTFGDGFLFISRTKDDYGRRQVFFRSKWLSSTIIDNNIPSMWLGDLAAFIPNGIIEVDMLSIIEVHPHINDYSSVDGMFGNMSIYYSNLDSNGNIVGLNADWGGDVLGSGGTDFPETLPDKRFTIPPGGVGNK